MKNNFINILKFALILTIKVQTNVASDVGSSELFTTTSNISLAQTTFNNTSNVTEEMSEDYLIKEPEEDVNYYKDEENTMPCNHFNTINITDGIKNSDYSITHRGITYSPNHYRKFDYIYKNQKTKILVENHTRGCICFYRKCIRSCCLPHQHYDAGCTDSDLSVENSLAFNVPVMVNGNKLVRNLLNDSVYDVTYPKHCNAFLMSPELEADDEWYIELIDGMLMLLNKGTKHSPDEYCLILGKNHTNDGEIYAAICAEDNLAQKYKLHPIGMILSIPFLIVTFLVYMCLREIRSTLNGKCVAAYVLTLFVFYTFLAGLQFNNGDDIPQGICYIIAFVIYGTHMGIFLWMSIISFDIWLTFGMGGLDNSDDRFWKYSLFACGIPVLFMIIAGVIEVTDETDKYRPKFELRCWFDHRNAELFYLFLPLMIIVICNIVFFTLTALEIRKAQENGKKLSRGDSQKHFKNHQDNFGLYLRLFIIMGITWTTEVLSWFTGPTSWFFIVPDLVNCGQGVLIFFLFVWKPRVRALLAKHYKLFKVIAPESIELTTIATDSKKREMSQSQ